MRDSFGRNIDYLRISITDRCNLRCTYCMPCDGFKPVEKERILSLEEILSVVQAGVELGITKVRLTGGEPLVRNGVVELVRAIAATAGIEVIAATTNGILLPRLARPLREAGLTGVNISLDTLDPERYARVTRGGRLEAVLAGIDAAISAGIPSIKINSVVAPDTPEEDLAAVRRFCQDRGLHHQRIALYHLDREKSDDHHCERPLPCQECNRVRLLSTGVFKPCLHSDEEIPFDPQDPGAGIRRAIEVKPERGTVCSNRSMVEIGG